jgi:hypothetical protein
MKDKIDNKMIKAPITLWDKVTLNGTTKIEKILKVS